MASRIKPQGHVAYYHCISRTVGGEFLLDSQAKRVFRKQMWKIADFCGVEVVTYCIMSNHFHLLVRVPDAAAVNLSDEELIRRFNVLYARPGAHQKMSAEYLTYHLQNQSAEAPRIRESLLRQMHDVSAFVKLLKQRFSIWYNQKHNRFGTLWAERFKSVLVEGGGEALYTVARYIDLNPVRAGIVDSPEDYEYCGIYEALHRNTRASQGLRRAVEFVNPRFSAEEAIQFYLKGLWISGTASKQGKRGKLDKAVLTKMLEAKEPLDVSLALRACARYFCDATILGSEKFVEKHAPDPARGRKANRLKGANWGDIYSLRNLQKNLFS